MMTIDPTSHPDDPAEIAAFLEARIDEEEAAARAATPGPWAVNDVEDDHRAGVLDAENNCLIEWYACGKDDARHITRQNPAVALARCAALRGLVGRLVKTIDRPSPRGARVMAGAALIGLAAIYRYSADGSQHPDWREEWTPDA